MFEEECRKSLDKLCPSQQAFDRTLAAMRLEYAATPRKQTERSINYKMNNRKFDFRIATAVCAALLVAVSIITGVMLSREKPGLPDTFEISDSSRLKSVRYVEPLENEIITYTLWRDVSELKITDETDLIAKVKIEDMREVEYEYTAVFEYEGERAETDHVGNGTLLQLSVEEVYYSADNKVKDTIVAYSIVSSRGMYLESPRMKSGDEYILFFSSTKDDVAQRDQFSDYIIRLPATASFWAKSGTKITAKMSEMLKFNCRLLGIDESVAEKGNMLDEALRTMFKQ